MFSSVMESWNYGSEEKGFKISDEIVSPADALQRNRQVLTGWDFRSSCNYDDSMELGFPGNVCRSFPDNQIGGDLRNKDGYGRADVSSCSSHLVNPRAACFREDESGTSIVDSNSWDSSLIDLKLGSLTDCGDGKSAKCSKDLQMLSSIVSSIPAKRARLSNLSTRPSFCQVHGCNMDLNSSKDYYKRHRVCEIHSKTAKVIVNGIQQRFCQQCSRFHLIAEFDDGKRSCRKRLAGHNERRRKPKLDNHPGGRYLGTSIPAIIPFICQDMFPSGLLNEIRHENDNNFYRCVKVEEKPIYSAQTSFPFLTPYGTEKQFTSLNASSFTMSYNNSNRYAQGLANPQAVSKSVGKVSMSDELSVLDVSSTIHGLSGVMDSGCALSLLSSQSHSSSTQNFGLPFARPLLVQGGVQHGATQYNQFPEKLLAVSSQGSNSVASNRFSSSGMNSVENEHLGTVLVSDASNAVEVENQADGMFHRVDYMKQKDHISYGEHESTVDLLQLSSQLQSVEHPRHSIQVKKEMEVFMNAPSSVWATRTCHVRDSAEELTMLEESQKLDNSFHLMNGFHSG